MSAHQFPDIYEEFGIDHVTLQLETPEVYQPDWAD